MKIKQIEIRNFRAFPNHEIPFLFKIDGKNLLLYGENGSGKSSLYFALWEFFNLDIHAERFETFANIFTDDPDNPNGSIRVTLEDGRHLTWDRNDSGIRAHHSATILDTDASFIRDGGRRAGFLSYLSLLQSRLGDQSSAKRLFSLVVNSILYGVQIPVSGREQSIHELWMNLQYQAQALSASPSEHAIEALDEDVTRFSNGLAAKLELLRTTTEELLKYFVGHGLTISFNFPPLAYKHHRTKIRRHFAPAELNVTIKFRGRTIDAWEGFLNEARLSALAVSLFLAGVLASNPTPPPGQDPLQLLVLDDVLFGLDMANRIPVLKILKDRFQDFQIILMTHDRVWYDIARGHLPQSNRWIHRELVADETDNLLIPRLRPVPPDLARADDHCKNGDLRAAAVYARSAFEKVLQNACEDNNVKIKYRRNSKEIRANDLWTAVVACQKQHEEAQKSKPNTSDFLPRPLIADCEAMRSNVLNALSHANSPGLNSADLTDAIQTIEKLQNHFEQVKKSSNPHKSST